MRDWMLRLLLIVMLILASVFPISTNAQPEPDRTPLKEASAPVASNGESDRDLILPDPLESQNEPEDRLVILPEIKREGERFYLSSFKLPDKLTFAGQPVPLDNWQVRERVEYEFYQFL